MTSSAHILLSYVKYKRSTLFGRKVPSDVTVANQSFKSAPVRAVANHVLFG